MTDLKMPINVTASVVLTIAFMLFLVFVFGRKNSRIYELPWYKTLAVKIGLALCTAGAFLNCLTLSNPPVSEIILNIGLALMFSWAAWFHYKVFVIPYKQMGNTQPCSKVAPKRKPRIKSAVK